MKKHKQPSLNIVERAIGGVAPGWAARRLKSKHVLAMADGGYTGASRTRNTMRNWVVGALSADDEVAYDRLSLIARSRDLRRNSPLAAGIINTSVTNVIGTGLALQSRIDAEALGLDEDAASAWQRNVEREWKFHAESKNIDVTRQNNFYGLQSLAFIATLESGDVFSIQTEIERADSPYRLAIQLVEADRVCNSGRQPNTTTLVDGVEMNEHGEPVRYHFADRHPEAYQGTAVKWAARDARGELGRQNVLHLFNRLRPGQTRGIPLLAPVIEPLKQLSRYTEAELQAAVIGASFAVFAKMDPEAFETLFDDSDKKSYMESARRWDGTVQSDINSGARAINLLPGEDITMANLSRPNALFDPFVMSLISQIGSGIGIPQEVLIKHFNSSYSAARAALLDAWRFFRWWRDWMASSFCQPIYEIWLDEAISIGRIKAPGFFTDPLIRHAWCGSQWVGDGPGSIDPMNEVNAAVARVELGTSTLAAESLLHDGIDWEVKARQRKRELALRGEQTEKKEDENGPA